MGANMGSLDVPFCSTAWCPRDRKYWLIHWVFNIIWHQSQAMHIRIRTAKHNGGHAIGNKAHTLSQLLSLLVHISPISIVLWRNCYMYFGHVLSTYRLWLDNSWFVEIAFIHTNLSLPDLLKKNYWMVACPDAVPSEVAQWSSSFSWQTRSDMSIGDANVACSKQGLTASPVLFPFPALSSVGDHFWGNIHFPLNLRNNDTGGDDIS
jgi:hypothetical protein